MHARCSFVTSSCDHLFLSRTCNLYSQPDDGDVSISHGHLLPNSPGGFISGTSCAHWYQSRYRRPNRTSLKGLTCCYRSRRNKPYAFYTVCLYCTRKRCRLRCDIHISYSFKFQDNWSSHHEVPKSVTKHRTISLTVHQSTWISPPFRYGDLQNKRHFPQCFPHPHPPPCPSLSRPKAHSRSPAPPPNQNSYTAAGLALTGHRGNVHSISSHHSKPNPAIR